MSRCSAPAIHEAQASGSVRVGPSSVMDIMSERWMRPPGDKTRKDSRKTASLSGDRQTTQLDMTTSTFASGSGIFSISPLTNSTLVMPRLAWFLRARFSMSSVMSRPVTWPSGPTCWDARKQSIPPPEPRSSTLSPAFRPARAVGLPQPAEAAMDSAGNPAI